MSPMLRRLLVAGPILGVVLALLWVSAERLLEPDRRPVEVVAAAAPARVPSEPDRVAEVVVDERDAAIFREKVTRARAEGLDTLPLGEVIARLGRTFVGTTYRPNTLDLDGPERLVVNLRELDCVTFVESMLAMARTIRAGSDDFADFLAELRRIRYRGGVLAGYPSRLHYFSDWIADNEAKGLVRDIGRELGGEPDAGAVDFMSTHPAAYRHLADPANLEAIRRTEAELGARMRYYIPERRIAEAAAGIRNGDLIAATSTVAGLDIAHTGIALWVDGRLHLLHAPLVGRSVEISEVPLADRILRIEGQDGIMVARPRS